jgi:hypothetical protein
VLEVQYLFCQRPASSCDGLHGTAAEFILEPMPVQKSSTTVYTPLGDGTGVLLDVETLLYFSLNRTGAVLWQELESNNPSTVDDLTTVLCERFDIDREAARPEIDDFVRQLERLKIVRTV